MSYSKLLTNLSFDSDPFAKTNADEEDRLVRYFISPPFFDAVYGDPSEPKSAVVFAPRGGGKTALKRRIEIASQNSNFLCVTYNEFDVAGLKSSQIDANYHLKNIVRLVLVATITAVADREIKSLASDHKHVLYLLAKAHLSQIDRTALKSSVAAIKNFPDKAADLWDKFTGPVGFALNALFAKVGFGAAEVSKFSSQGGAVGSYIDQLKALRDIAKSLGFDSIYVLIDKVDETSITGKASTSYEFIEPIVTDLLLLELPGFAFKFFLWDLLLDSYRKSARPDRVKYYQLEWSELQLVEMLSERLKAFSSDAVESFSQVVDDSGKTADPDLIVAMFAQGSPRKMIRICKEILDQQSELAANANAISHEAFVLGVDQIAQSLCTEEFDSQQLRDLKRNRRVDFTIRHVYLEVFKFTQQAGMNKVKSWEDSGLVEFLGTIKDTKGAKASNHYGLSNFLLAKYVCADLPVFDFIEKKIRRCGKCREVVMRDWDLLGEHVCQSCQADVAA
ncbi:P-loop ATPase, Sll1717 family [Pseudoxanthomonas mexicana]|uniref:P-loop ATPase, Sll1717 family n=1 Tax=Pseudoxanthomonas mexicana TaxID=128785 RepID=UPI0020A1A800|nr:hypothetical protein [Pseudoxanthomonas mexicana]MCP1582917.1 hypothetical protein [Pseudoxanthomonas mexicana]